MTSADSIPLAMPLVSSNSQASTSRAPRRKAPVENWDDDFEFSLPSRPNQKTSGGAMKKSDSGESRAENAAPPRTPRRASPTESFMDSWDDSPPTVVNTTPSRRSSRIAPLQVPSQQLGPPRLSPSPTIDLPPSSFTPSQAGARKTSGISRSKSGSTKAPATRNKLVKRHPSASFVSIPSAQWAGSDISLVNRSSPYLPPEPESEMIPPLPPLPRSRSGEEMPPPPVPTRLGRSKSKSKRSKEARPHDGVRVSGIPFSPSQENLYDEEKKPKFGKRLSALPTERRAPSEHRRRRSSSVGGKTAPDISNYPPPPPLPVNIRSPSQASTTSASSSTRSGPGNAFSSLLRRSTSSLSRWSDKSHNTPPSAFSRQVSARSMRTSAVPICPDQQCPPESPPLSRSFSRGFHLPSPSRGSPYHHCGPAFANGLQAPPLPHSLSFPTATSMRLGTDTDSESETGDQQTPKRRKKVRPVSALPAPKRPAQTTGPWQDAPGLDAPPSPAGFATSTLKRLGSLSQKHGRRLSGGFKFGTQSSSSSNEGKREKLETVVGSPSKLGRAALEVADEAHRGREMSVSAPNSLIRPSPAHKQAEEFGDGLVSEGIPAKKTDSQRRRQSWNDFVIPRDVQAKQKGVRESIAAFKQFATRVEALKALLQTHADLTAQIQYGRNDNAKASFAALESEFAQWWEMATLFIALSTTTQAASVSHASRPASPRTRRITLASDEAHAASNAIERISDSSRDTSFGAVRKISLPDPESADLLGGPPRATPEHWRGSTGRQDLSKRQLDMLKDMIHTPLSGTRPVPTRRQTSTLSASSTASSILPLTQGKQADLPGSKTMRHLPRSTPTPTDRTNTVTMPGSGDSAYIVPSGSFPSPTAATDMARPMAKRWPSRAGLAGLKDFLRSLKNPSAQKTPTAKVRKGRPSPLAIQPGIQQVQGGPATPISPTRPLSSSFEQLRFPINSSNQSSFSAVGGGGGGGGGRGTTGKERSPSPRKGHGTRPSIMHMFRSGSGNWSELVRGGSGSEIPTKSPVDGMPQGGGRGVAKQASRHSLAQSTTTDHSDLYPPSMLGLDDDGTLRPTRKSRIMGLGYPEPPLPSTDANNRNTTSPIVHPSAPQYDSPDRSASAPAWVFPTAQSPLMNGGNETEGEEWDEEALEMVALTPENLPGLIGYLRQCEAKLGEWRKRVQDVGFGGTRE